MITPPLSRTLPLAIILSLTGMAATGMADVPLACNQPMTGNQAPEKCLNFLANEIYSYWPEGFEIHKITCTTDSTSFSLPHEFICTVETDTPEIQFVATVSPSCTEIPRIRIIPFEKETCHD